MSSNYSIAVHNVTLAYDLYFDRTSSFKEYWINLIKRRKYVDKKKESLLALNNISFELNEGDRVGIIGRNGAGKSTALKVVSGILKPTHGDVHVSGKIQPLIEIGAGFNPEFSGRENIYFNGYMLGFNRRQIKDREVAIIEFSELGKFIDVPLKYYSSGMTMRLAFSMATNIEPELLVFDEMLSAGDAAFIVKAKQRMDELLGQAKLLLIVSHDLELLKALTKRILVLEHGQVVFDGPPKESIDYYMSNIVAPQQAAPTLI